MEETVDKILSKTLSLYEKYGIRSVTMDDVAKELRISKKTLYRYVSNKADLVEKVMFYKYKCVSIEFHNISNSTHNAIDELLEVNAYLNRIHNNINHSIEFDLQKYYPEVWERLHIKRRDFMYESIQENIKKGKKEGVYRKELCENIIAKIHVLRIENKSINDLFSENELCSTKVNNEIFNYHIRGICNAKGIEYYENKLNQKNNHNAK